MRFLPGVVRTQTSFNDQYFVSRVVLVATMALAQCAGHAGLIADHVLPGGPCGVYPELKVPCLVVGWPPGRAASMTWTRCGMARRRT